MTVPMGVYHIDDAKEIHRRVLGQASSQPFADNTRDKTIHNLLYYALLTEDLAAASDSLTGYTQAEIRVLRYVQPVDPGSLDMEESTTSAGLIQVTNRFSTFSASSGDLLLVIRNGSEWSPVNVVSSALKHATVLACYGNGYYTANLATTPLFSFPSFSETGTGTTEGVGTGSALYNECDMCSLIYGETAAGVGTAEVTAPATCGDLSQPYRVSVGADGDLIYVYDPRKLALASGAHIVVADMGDRIEDPNPTVGTGTGTGTGTATTAMVVLWIVQTGNYDLVAIPDRFYECCDGVPYLVRCDSYIVEGAFCQGVTASCPGTA